MVGFPVQIPQLLSLGIFKFSGGSWRFDRLLFLFVFDKLTFCIGMLENKAQIARERTKIVELEGTSGFALIFCPHPSPLQVTIPGSAPPPPHFHRFRWYLCAFPISGSTPPISGGNWQTLLHDFLRYPPLSRELFPCNNWPPISGTLWWPLFPFFLFNCLFFLLGKYEYVFYHYPRGALPQVCDVIGALSPFSGGYWSTYKSYPTFLISREASENTSYLGRLV